MNESEAKKEEVNDINRLDEYYKRQFVDMDNNGNSNDNNALINAGNSIIKSINANSSKTLKDFSFRAPDKSKNHSYFTSFRNTFDITRLNDNGNKKRTNNFMVNINSTKVINLQNDNSNNNDKYSYMTHVKEGRHISSFKSNNKLNEKKRKTVKFKQRRIEPIEYEDWDKDEMVMHPNIAPRMPLTPIDKLHSNTLILKKYYTNAINTQPNVDDDNIESKPEDQAYLNIDTTANDNKRKSSKVHSDKSKKRILCSNKEFTQLAKIKAEAENNFIVYTQKSGYINGFSAHSFINRQYTNEDKLGININFKSHNNSKIDFYGLYDGHNGTHVAELLYKRLHTEIYSNESFPMDPITSIIKSFHKIEKTFIDSSSFIPLNSEEIDISGSCALLLLVVDDSYYFVNLGDSRAMISLNEGASIRSLTIDHKPHISTEMKRIHYAGGKIEGKYYSSNEMKSKVYPGGLSISRSIGDIPSKIVKYGGKPDVISPIPDIFVLKPKQGIDFILLGTNSIYETVSNKQIALIAFETLLHSILHNESYKDYLTNVIINVKQRAIDSNAKENMSIVFLVMNTIKVLYDTKDEKKVREAIERIKMSSSDGLSLYNDFAMENVFTGNVSNYRRTNQGVNDTSINLKTKSTLLTLTGLNCDSRFHSTIETKKDKEKKSVKKRIMSCCGIFS